LSSVILWGPPGVGKTSLARLIARLTPFEFIPFSAVLSGIKEIKAVMVDAERLRRWAAAPSSSSTKSTASTRRSRTPFCRTWSAATSS
jgi:adenylate kinase family enzyme